MGQGLHCILQGSFGSGKSPQGKGTFVPLPQGQPQPAQWAKPEKGVGYRGHHPFFVLGLICTHPSRVVNPPPLCYMPLLPSSCSCAAQHRALVPALAAAGRFSLLANAASRCTVTTRFTACLQQSALVESTHSQCRGQTGLCHYFSGITHQFAI